MSTELVEAKAEDAGVIAALLDDYLREIARHREVAVGATDSASYPYPNAYSISNPLADGVLREPFRRAAPSRPERRRGALLVMQEPS
jgi:hypothetical protein